MNGMPDVLGCFRITFSSVSVTQSSTGSIEAIGANSTVDINGSTVSGGNPLLDPTRATTADLGLEWYFQEGAMLGLAVFYKDIDSFIQNTRESIFR